MFYLCTWNKWTFFHMQALSLQNTVPMNYYTAFHHIAELLPKDCVIVSEGANTMDIGRTMLLNYLPRRRSCTSVYLLFSPSLFWGKNLLPPNLASFQTANHAVSEGSVTHGRKHSSFRPLPLLCSQRPVGQCCSEWQGRKSVPVSKISITPDIYFYLFHLQLRTWILDDPWIDRVDFHWL